MSDQHDDIEGAGRPGRRRVQQAVPKHALHADGDDEWGGHPCCRAWVAEQAHGRGWRSAGASAGAERPPRAAPPA